MATVADISSGAGVGLNWSSAAVTDVAAKIGVPFAVLIIILSSLAPKIDRGIAIADHVDAELQYLAAVGCAPTRVGNSPTAESVEPPTPLVRP